MKIYRGYTTVNMAIVRMLTRADKNDDLVCSMHFLNVGTRNPTDPQEVVVMLETTKWGVQTYESRRCILADHWLEPICGVMGR